MYKKKNLIKYLLSAVCVCMVFASIGIVLGVKLRSDTFDTASVSAENVENVIDGDTVYAFLGQDSSIGTDLSSADTVYTTINTVDDFINMRSSSRAYRLGADIDLSSVSSGIVFNGTLDGAGYKLRNLRCTPFSSITGANISNLVIDNANIVNNGVSFLVDSATNSSISNITINSNSHLSTQRSYAGAIAASITNCNIDSCTVLGTISGKTVGGVVGYCSHSGGDSSINNCDTHGATLTGTTVGGIVGCKQQISYNRIEYSETKSLYNNFKVPSGVSLRINNCKYTSKPIGNDNEETKYTYYTWYEYVDEYDKTIINQIPYYKKTATYYNSTYGEVTIDYTDYNINKVTNHKFSQSITRTVRYYDRYEYNLAEDGLLKTIGKGIANVCIDIVNGSQKKIPEGEYKLTISDTSSVKTLYKEKKNVEHIKENKKVERTFGGNVVDIYISDCIVYGVRSSVYNRSISSYGVRSATDIESYGDFSTSTKVFSGSGTEQDPYIIESAYDLCVMMQRDIASPSDSNVFYKLANNISFSSSMYNVSPSAWVSTNFPENYTIDGNGKSVSGLKDAFVNVNNGTIKNLIFYANIQARPVDGTERQYVGAIANENSTTGTIDNCSVNAEIINGQYVGAIVGYNAGLVNNCVTILDGTTATSITATNPGGLVGYNAKTGILNVGSFINGNKATLSTIQEGSYSYVGALAAYNEGTISINTSYNYTFSGSYSRDSLYFGSVVGYNKGIVNTGVISTTINCTGSNTVYVGGVVGYNSEGTINVDGLADIVLKYGCVQGSVGGVSGYNNGVVNVESVSGAHSFSITNNYTAVYSSSNYVGGIVGYNENKVNINSSIGVSIGNNAKTIAANIGGIIGYNGEMATLITRSIVSSTITNSAKDAELGGIVGVNKGAIQSNAPTQFSRDYLYKVTISNEAVGCMIGGLVADNTNTAILTNNLNSDKYIVEGKINSTGNSCIIGGAIGSSMVDINGVRVSITSTSSVLGSYIYLGGVVGKAYGTEPVNVSDSYCNWKLANISNSNYFGLCFGGVVGDIVGNVEGCVSYFEVDSFTLSSKVVYFGGIAGHIVGDIKDSTSSFRDRKLDVKDNITYCGGIAGYMQGSIDNCSTSLSNMADTSLQSKSYIGGYVGYLEGDIRGVDNHTITIQLRANNSVVGGLVGQLVDGSITDIGRTTAKISMTGSSNVVGGVVGQTSNENASEISFTEEGLLSIDLETTGSNNNYIAGVLGNSDNIVVIKNVKLDNEQPNRIVNNSKDSYVFGLSCSPEVTFENCNLDGLSLENAGNNCTIAGFAPYSYDMASEVGGYYDDLTSPLVDISIVNTASDCIIAGFVTNNCGDIAFDNYRQVGTYIETSTTNIVGTISNYNYGLIAKCQVSSDGAGITAVNFGVIDDCKSDSFAYFRGKAYTSAGCIAGINMSSGEGDVVASIINCSVNVNINSSAFNYIGAIAGVLLSSVVDSCTVSGNITLPSNAIGTIASMSAGSTITDCVNTATISNNKTGGYVGGIVGSSNSDTIVNCMNMNENVLAVDVNASYGYTIGGIVGQAMESTIINCYNERNLGNEDSYMVGGIVGECKDCIITYCVNNGVCSYDDADVSSCVECGALVGQVVGGLVGRYTKGDKESLISYSYCTASMYAVNNIKPNSNAVSGGLVGEVSVGVKLSISKSYYDGRIEYVDVAGLIIGQNYSKNYTLTSCYGSLGNNVGPYTLIGNDEASNKGTPENNIRTNKGEKIFGSDKEWIYKVHETSKINYLPQLTSIASLLSDYGREKTDCVAPLHNTRLTIEKRYGGITNSNNYSVSQNEVIFNDTYEIVLYSASDFNFDYDIPGYRAVRYTLKYTYGSETSNTFPLVIGKDAKLTIEYEGMFESGDGVNQPYLISNATQYNNFIQAIAKWPDKYKDKKYELGNDIEFDQGSTLAPIGTYLEDYSNLKYRDTIIPFVGLFNGNSHKISGINITSNKGYVGLFAHNKGEIYNLEVEANVSGNGYVGIIAGYNEGKISNVKVYGSVDGNNFTGGITGYNDGKEGSNAVVDSSRVYARVNGEDYVGGAVGCNGEYGSVSTVANTNNVFGNNNVGGIVGYNAGSINEGFTLGIVNGAQNVGGIVGYNKGTITNVHNLGSVSATDDCVGGIAGYNLGSISYAYAIKRVALNNRDLSKTKVGVIAGHNNGTITATSAWIYDGSTSVGASGSGSQDNSVKYSDIRSLTYIGGNKIFGDSIAWEYKNNEGTFAFCPYIYNLIDVYESNNYIDIAVDVFDPIIFERGRGTKDNPFIIANKEQFYNFKLFVDETLSLNVDKEVENKYADKIEEIVALRKTVEEGGILGGGTPKTAYYRLEADITIDYNDLFDDEDGSIWLTTFIDTFSGTLEANGHTIRNVATLFGELRNANISGINLTDCILQLNVVDFSTSGKEDKRNVISFLANYVFGGTIDSCSVVGDILKGNNKQALTGVKIDSIGMLAAYIIAGAQITNCSVKGDIKYSNISYTWLNGVDVKSLGGIVGTCLNTSTECTINSCEYTGTISGGAVYIGGIIGNTTEIGSKGIYDEKIGSDTYGYCYVKNCIFNGSIDITPIGMRSWQDFLSKNVYIGGIVGLGFANKCINKGNITVNGCRFVGGVVGFGGAVNCKNEGDVKIVGDSFFVGGVVGMGSAVGSSNYGKVISDVKTLEVFTNGLGGIVGYGFAVADCHNYGDVAGTNNSVGGVVGQASNASIASCHNEGSITGNNVVGGIVGGLKTSLIGDAILLIVNNGQAPFINIYACYNLGTVTGKYHVGGIVGVATDVDKCFNTGVVSGYKYIGGIAGSSKQSVTTSYNIANISASYGAVGGIAGQGAKVEACYNTGSVIGPISVGGIMGNQYVDAVKEADADDRTTTTAEVFIMNSFYAVDNMQEHLRNVYGGGAEAHINFAAGVKLTDIAYIQDNKIFDNTWCSSTETKYDEYSLSKLYLEYCDCLDAVLGRNYIETNHSASSISSTNMAKIDILGENFIDFVESLSDEEYIGNTNVLNPEGSAYTKYETLFNSVKTLTESSTCYVVQDLTFDISKSVVIVNDKLVLYSDNAEYRDAKAYIKQLFGEREMSYVTTDIKWYISNVIDRNQTEPDNKLLYDGTIYIKDNYYIVPYVVRTGFSDKPVVVYILVNKNGKVGFFIDDIENLYTAVGRYTRAKSTKAIVYGRCSLFEEHTDGDYIYKANEGNKYYLPTLDISGPQDDMYITLGKIRLTVYDEDESLQGIYNIYEATSIADSEIYNSILGDRLGYDISSITSGDEMFSVYDKLYKDTTLTVHYQAYFDDVYDYDDIDCFEISTASQLVNLSNLVNSDENYRSLNYRLVNDIDMSGVIIDPIGSLENPFVGTFDGNGYTIYNLSINSYDYYVGLFGYLGEGAEVINLAIVNASITALQSNARVGILAGGASSAGIDSCVVNGTAQAARVGGVVGGVIGEIATETTIYRVAVIKTNLIADSYVGGFVGKVIDDSYVQMINSYIVVDMTRTRAIDEETIEDIIYIGNGLGEMVDCSRIVSVKFGNAETTKLGSISEFFNDYLAIVDRINAQDKFDGESTYYYPIPYNIRSYYFNDDYKSIYEQSIYTMSFSGEGIDETDSEYATRYYYSETVAVEPATPTYDDVMPEGRIYVFEGWFDGDEKWDFSNTINRNLELVARWNIAKTVEGKAVTERTKLNITATDGLTTIVSGSGKITLNLTTCINDLAEELGYEPTIYWYRDDIIIGINLTSLDITEISETGRYYVVATVTDGVAYQRDVSNALEILVRQRPYEGDLTAPTVETVYFDGITLGDIELPDNWSWKNPNTKVYASNDVQKYSVIYTPEDAEYAPVDSMYASVKINKQLLDIDVTDVITEYVYTGRDIVIDSGASVEEGILVQYKNNVLRDPGTYELTVYILESENYRASSKNVQIHVSRANSTISAETVQYVAYNGNIQRPYVSIGNTEQQLVYSIDTTDVGSYTVNVKAAQSTRYNESNELTITFIILRNELKSSDEANPQVKIVSDKGFNAEASVSAEELTDADNIERANMIIVRDCGEEAVLAKLVDISVSNATRFIDTYVEILAPVGIDSASNVRVLHINDSGETEEIEATVVDGYVRFRASSFSQYAIIHDKVHTNDYLKWLIPVLFVAVGVITLATMLIYISVKNKKGSKTTK